MCFTNEWVPLLVHIELLPQRDEGWLGETWMEKKMIR
jgi:hypothetical protein